MKKICVLLVMVAAIMTTSCSDDFQEIDQVQIENSSPEAGDGENEPGKGGS